jgi:hypothetical protein
LAYAGPSGGRRPSSEWRRAGNRVDLGSGIELGSRVDLNILLGTIPGAPEGAADRELDFLQLLGLDDILLLSDETGIV